MPGRFRYEWGAVGASQDTCDFCNNAQCINWQYDCGNFELPDETWSVGPWIACDKCHDLIEQDQYDLLCEWALSTALEHGGLPKEKQQEFRDIVIETHKRFKRYRYGPVEQYTGQGVAK